MFQVPSESSSNESQQNNGSSSTVANEGSTNCTDAEVKTLDNFINNRLEKVKLN